MRGTQIRNFLWNQPYISRFNEEGKKSKSKGNHIWHVDAKKCEGGGWTFRPFQRKLAGAPPGVAYIGLRWSWTPRIWDPQASRANLPVTYTSPNLPSWLSWNEDTLSGIPPPDAESCDVTVEARVGGLILQRCWDGPDLRMFFLLVHSRRKGRDALPHGARKHRPDDGR